jgi:CRAL/TRIO domain
VIVGNINVVDLRGCGLSLLSQITPSVVKKLSSLLEPFPVRVKAIHLINPPKGMEVAFKMFMSVCHEKLRNRVYMHESFNELKRVSPDVCKALPKDYGGDSPSTDEIIATWKKDLFNNSQWFVDDEQYGITKTTATINNTMFGAEGSFRSLNID